MENTDKLSELEHKIRESNWFKYKEFTYANCKEVTNLLREFCHQLYVNKFVRDDDPYSCIINCWACHDFNEQTWYHQKYFNERLERIQYNITNYFVLLLGCFRRLNILKDYEIKFSLYLINKDENALVNTKAMYADGKWKCLYELPSKSVPVVIKNYTNTLNKYYERLEKDPDNEYVKANIEIYKKEISFLESTALVTTMYYIPDYEKESN